MFFPSIQLDPETELIKDHDRVFLDMDGSSMVWQLGYVILIYLLSPIRSSQFLTNYIDFLCILDHSVWQHGGCILQLHGFQINGYLKPLSQKVSLHRSCWLSPEIHLDISLFFSLFFCIFPVVILVCGFYRWLTFEFTVYATVSLGDILGFEPSI